MKRIVIAAAIAVLTALTAMPAAAYVGPGAGLSMLGALWGLLVAVLAAIAFVIAWPVRRYLRRRRARREGEHGTAGEAGSGTTSDEHAREASADSQGRF